MAGSEYHHRDSRQVAKDFGVSESCLARWLRVADRDAGVPAAASPSMKGD
jgi:transposase